MSTYGELARPTHRAMHMISPHWALALLKPDRALSHNLGVEDLSGEIPLALPSLGLLSRREHPG